MSTRRELAERSLRLLVGRVFEGRNRGLKPIDYGVLSKEIGRHPSPDFGQGMGFVLGVMGHMLDQLGGKWGEPLPRIQSLVVLRRGPLRGLPDEGMNEFWPDYPRLSHEEKEQRVRLEYERIADFGSRWDDVLVALNLEPIRPAPPTVGVGTGGESNAHKALKEYVRSNPSVVGVPPDAEAFTEYVLPTLDTIDVLFRTPEHCVSVEVKSRVSEAWPGDFERGIFQTLKYAAILEAMHVAGRLEARPKVRSVLVLETCLPAHERTLATRLGVEVIEGVQPS